MPSKHHKTRKSRMNYCLNYYISNIAINLIAIIPVYDCIFIYVYSTNCIVWQCGLIYMQMSFIHRNVNDRFISV